MIKSGPMPGLAAMPDAEIRMRLAAGSRLEKMLPFPLPQHLKKIVNQLQAELLSRQIGIDGEGI